MDETQSPPLPDESPKWLTLARLLRPQGRRGELLAELLTDFPDRFDENPRVFLAPTGYSGSMTAARMTEVLSHWMPVGRNQGRIVLHFKGINSINEAEKLTGLDVLVPEIERLDLDDDDAAYISDLVGCTVVDLAQEAVTLGHIADVHFAMSADGARRLEDAAPLLSIETPEGDEILVPFVKAFLISIDVAAKRIEMRLPQGLIEVNR